MKWFTHKTFALTSALALDAPITGVVATFIGSVLPDVTERTLSMGDMRIWGKIHRQAAHWFGWYLLPMFFCASALYTYEAEKPAALFLEAVTWLCFGGLTHIALDALTPRGVPLWPLGGKRRIVFPLVTTGRFSELVFFIFIATLFMFQTGRQTQLASELLEKSRDILSAPGFTFIFGQ